nr:MAG TPA: tail completion protein [Caudoviricetes sp.]
MIIYADIIKEVNLILKREYPNIKRYGNDTVDNAVPPYFFVEVVPFGINRESRNMMHKSCSVKITFVQKVTKQTEALEVIENIFDSLGMVLIIKDRRLLVTEYTHDYIEDHGNIPQMSFKLDWYESTEYHDGELIEDIHLKVEKKERK